MDKKELIEFLKEELHIDSEQSFDQSGEVIEIQLMFGCHVISTTKIRITDPE